MGVVWGKYIFYFLTVLSNMVTLTDKHRADAKICTPWQCSGILCAQLAQTQSFAVNCCLVFQGTFNEVSFAVIV